MQLFKKKKTKVNHKRKISEIILHCSASDNPSHDDIKVIRLWHLKRKWKDVGYHYYIRKDGTLEKGRAESDSGAHVRGRNKYSIGICLGGLEEFTKEQFETAGKLVKMLLNKYDLKKSDVNPHNKYSNKLCPVYDIKEVLKRA